MIRPGQRLVIPTSSGNTEGQKIHTVQSGDTLWKLSQRYGVSITAIKSANNYWSDVIRLGQRLIIPTGSVDTGTSQPPSNNGGQGGYTAQDKNLLSRLISAESRGEPFEGQVAVGGVVLNRVKSSQFPNTIPGVIYQPYQFSPVLDGSINKPATSSAIRAMEAALTGWDPSYGSLFFYNPTKVRAGNYVWSRPIVRKIGNHVFAK